MQKKPGARRDLAGAPAEDTPRSGPLKRLAVKYGLRGALGLVGLGLFSLLALYFYTLRAPDMAQLWHVERAPSYTILDAKGQTLAIRGSFYGEDVTVEELPPHLVQAFLAIEDNRFYEHLGIDPKGLARAMVVNLKAGRSVQGGSTISQQLAKNLFLSNERTMTRKVSELIHTIWLERHLEKNQILSLYLNRIYLGAGTYGVDAASRFYFGKSVRDVSLAEAAMLASLPKAPSRYAPTADLARAQKRAELVLANMERFGYIDQDQALTAKANPAEPFQRPVTDNLGYFMDAVIQKITQIVGTPEADIVVETTIDMDLQSQAEKTVAEVLDAKGEEAKAGEAAFIAFSPDGSLRAMVGGRSYAQSQFNRAFQAKRQPGSAFKPFVYLTALENGFSHKDAVFDEPVKVGDWTPKNYGGSYQGRMTVSEALERSVNTVAVWLSETVGREKVIDTAHRLGITSEISNNRAIALGAVEVTPYELAGAYLTFANNGIAVEPHMIKKVRTEKGAILYQREGNTGERVIDQDVAQTMTHMLYQAVQRGTGRNANIDPYPVAGKTGTSQDYRDAWFVGYSGQYVAAAWVGNDDNSPMSNVTGASLPSEIWKTTMAAAHRGKEIVPLPGAYRNEPDPFESEEMRSFLVSLRDRLDSVQHGSDMRRRVRYEERRDADSADWRDLSHEERERRAREWAQDEGRGRKRSWWPF